MRSARPGRASWCVPMLGAVLVGVGSCRCPEPAASPPSVLVLLWDTVRADRMSVYGAEVPTTPRLEALADEFVVYERAMSPGMWTVPSHASMFTGLPASTTGARVGWIWLDGHHLTLAEHFRDHGYATFAWSANPYLSSATNLLQGFEVQRVTWQPPSRAASEAATRAKLMPEDRSVAIAPGWAGPDDGWPSAFTLVKDAGPAAVDDVFGFVDGLAPDAPFLVYVNLLEAHHPRIPAAASRHAVAPPEVVTHALSTDQSLFRLMAAMEGRATLSDDDHTALRATYDATLRDLDAVTGRFIDGLRDRGRLERTIVVVVSDHGEHLGENGRYDHRWSVDQELLHVPLLVRGPVGRPPGRTSALVSTRGLFGSLVAWTGLPVPATAPPTLDTAPVASELIVPTPRLPTIRAAYPDLPRRRWASRFRVWFDGSHKLVQRDDGAVRLFDLDAPGRVDGTPVPDAEPRRALLQALRTFDGARPRYRPERRGEGDRPGRPLHADPALAEQLRQLGYTDGLEEP